MSNYISYSARGGGGGGGTTIPMYINFAAFPGTANNGTIAIALDTGLLYEYNSVTPGWQLITALNPIPSSQKAAANGVATLDSGGKVPASQLPSSVMDFKGVWNATTNIPGLANGTGDAGDVYLCNVAGTTNFGAGPIAFAIGDWAVYDGSIWQKSLNSNAVVSVNGLQGVVTLTTDNINEGSTNLYFTTARARTAAVVNSLAGTQTDQAPSVASVNSAITAATGANASLSNLASVSLNQSLVPNAAGTLDLGSSTKPFGVTYSKSLYNLDNSNSIVGILTFGATGPTLLSNVSNGDVTLQPAGTGTVIVQNKRITSLADPTSAQDAATKAYVDTSAAAGANRTLSNLTSPTAIAVALRPDLGANRNLGAAGFDWNALFINSILDPSGNAVLAAASRQLYATDGSTVMMNFGSTTGVTSITQSPGNNSTRLATTAFVTAAITAGAGANTTLSNLGTTSINANLIAASPGSITLGNSVNYFNSIHSQFINFYDNSGVFQSQISYDSSGMRITANQANGNITIVPFGAGTIIASSKKITSLADPTSAQDAATKAYVDTAGALKANIASPTFTGVAAAPTASSGTNTTQLATTAFVQSATTFVGARARASIATTIAASGTTTNVNFNVVDYDTNSGVTTGSGWKYTVPFTGKYTVKSIVGLDTPGASVVVRLLIYINNSGTVYSFTQYVTQPTGEAAYLTLSDTLNLTAGDFIQIRGSNSSAVASTTTLTNAASSVIVAIEKIGN